MALLKIARMGHPVLRQRAETVQDPTSETIRRLAGHMAETMDDAEGIGLAAPQVYVSQRLVMFQVPPDRLEEGEPPGPPGITVLVNPEIKPVGDEVALGVEGCLSMPGLRGVVPRHHTIVYRGVTPAGERIEREATGLHARVVQHEVDHLDGILFVDRMDDFTTLCFESEMHHLFGEEDPGDQGDD
jgi:peptide deformylase